MRGFTSLEYWSKNTQSGWSKASSRARRTAPLEPSAPGVATTSAPNTSSIRRRSVETFSGMTMVIG